KALKRFCAGRGRTPGRTPVEVRGVDQLEATRGSASPSGPLAHFDGALTGCTTMQLPSPHRLLTRPRISAAGTGDDAHGRATNEQEEFDGLRRLSVPTRCSVSSFRCSGWV